MESVKITVSKLRSGPIARALVNLGISVAGLLVVRLIVQNLPMFQDMGWIVQDKLTVMAAALIVVDAMLLAVLVGFAIQVREYLFARFAEMPGLGTMAVSLALLLSSGLAYTDFKPLTRAWPAIRGLYVWMFFILAVALLAHVIFLLYKNRDRMAAMILRQPAPAVPSQEHAQSEEAQEAEEAFAAR